MNLQGSPGFIYYTLENPPKEESSDFISFNDSNTSKDNAFSPSAFSSPQDYNRKSPRAYNNNANNRRGRRYHNSNNYSRTPNSFRRSYNSINFANKLQESAYTKYLHPSFTENPWRHLEKAKGSNTEKLENERSISDTA